MIKAVLFDMDKTLLDINFNTYALYHRAQLNNLIGQISGISALELAPITLKSYMALIEKDRDYSLTNHEVFTNRFYELSSIPLQDPIIEEALNYWDLEVMSKNNNKIINAHRAKGAIEALDKAKSLGLKVVLATNPTYPKSSVMCRLGWAGLDTYDFDYITHSQNSYSLKPSAYYYTYTAKQIGLSPQECLMVGNDAKRDVVRPNIGMKTAYIGHGISMRAAWSGSLPQFTREMEYIIDGIEQGVLY